MRLTASKASKFIAMIKIYQS